MIRGLFVILAYDNFRHLDPATVFGSRNQFQPHILRIKELTDVRVVLGWRWDMFFNLKSHGRPMTFGQGRKESAR
jgi:hypothetical protein